MGVCAVEICRLLKVHIDFLPVRDVRIRFTQRLPVRKNYWSLKRRRSLTQDRILGASLNLWKSSLRRLIFSL